MGSTGARRVTEMDEERLSLRVAAEDLQAMDDYLAVHPELGKSRSLLIRNAIRSYIDRDADVAVQSPGQGGLYVRFTETELQAMQYMVDRGEVLDSQEFVRRVVGEKLVPNIGERASAAMNLASADATRK
jgi:hypothetical protein